MGSLLSCQEFLFNHHIIPNYILAGSGIVCIFKARLKAQFSTVFLSMFQAHVFLQVHRLTCRKVAVNAVNSLSVVNNAYMSPQVELGGRLKLATWMCAGMTDSVVNSFDVLT